MNQHFFDKIEPTLFFEKKRCPTFFEKNCNIFLEKIEVDIFEKKLPSSPSQEGEGWPMGVMAWPQRAQLGRTWRLSVVTTQASQHWGRFMKIYKT